MVFKELVAYLAASDGTCNDINAERKSYDSILSQLQLAVDRARELNPDWTEERLHEYASGGHIGKMLEQTKTCLDSLGYDTSTLPHVIVPEFPVPGMAGLITAGAMGGLLAYMKARNWFYNRKDSENRK
jgi:hypothetical protein